MKKLILLSCLLIPATAQAQIHYPVPVNNGFVATPWQDTEQGRETIRQREESRRTQEEIDRRQALYYQQQEEFRRQREEASHSSHY